MSDNNPEVQQGGEVHHDNPFKQPGFFGAVDYNQFPSEGYQSLEAGSSEELKPVDVMNDQQGDVGSLSSDEKVRKSIFFSREIEEAAEASLGLHDFSEKIKQYGIRETDQQFSIASHMNFDPYFKDTHDREAIDIIHPATKERVYVTKPSDAETESALTQAVGDMATLPRIGEVGPYTVFEIPRGSRSLLRTFMSAPYEKEYMQRLAAKSWQFTDLLLHIDARGLAEDYHGFALTHNGESEDGDDVHITLKPPLKSLSEGVDAKVLQRRAKEFKKNSSNSLAASIKKLKQIALEDPEMAAEDTMFRFFLPEDETQRPS